MFPWKYSSCLYLVNAVQSSTIYLGMEDPESRPLKSAYFPANYDAVEFDGCENNFAPECPQELEVAPNSLINVLRDPLRPANNYLNYLENVIQDSYKSHSKIYKAAFLAMLTAGWTAYVTAACLIDFNKALNLVCVSAFALFCTSYWAVKKHAGDKIWERVLKPCEGVIMLKSKIFKRASIVLFLAFISFWIMYDAAKQPERLISLVGLFVYVLIGWLCSHQRSKVKWRPVLWGLALQFIFGLLILRTTIGFQIFKWLGDRVSLFLHFSVAGSEFLFNSGDLGLHGFAFNLLPVVVFFAAFIYMMYYFGVIQVVIKKIAWILHLTMGTSPAESVNAAANIFIGQTEAPLFIRPFLDDITISELHAVMTGGFATIAGGLFGAYISFGISATHLLSASVMSAPAALAMAKLMYPETEQPKIANVDDIKIERGKENNAFEALAAGASMSIALVANIAVMLVAFLSMLRFFNAFLAWLGRNVGYYELSFERICSYVLMPFAYVMGVEWNDAFAVAELLGTKTFLNEFIAYKDLSEVMKNRKWDRSGTKISLRSETIATYALCGFANIGSMGVQIGGISALAPRRRADLARVALRALIAGSISCFMTASIAGVLYDESKDDSVIKDMRTTIASSNATMSVFTTLIVSSARP